jgi:hypothetical protein
VPCLKSRVTSSVDWDGVETGLFDRSELGGKLILRGDVTVKSISAEGRVGRFRINRSKRDFYDDIVKQLR